MTQTILQIIKASMMCEELIVNLDINEEDLCILNEKRDNCGAMSISAQVDDIQKANKKILLYIDSIRDKQRVITPAQISIELGYSKEFIETILIANGFLED